MTITVARGPKVRGLRDDPELGRVRTCTRCGEEWPLDGEFFPKGNVQGFHSWCKACWAEYTAGGAAAHRRGTPA